MNLVGYKSPGRKATADKLRAISRPVAVNCPDIFATDKEFMRLFWASKRVDPKRRPALFDSLMTKLRERGIYLQDQAAKAEEESNAA